MGERIDEVTGEAPVKQERVMIRVIVRDLKEDRIVHNKVGNHNSSQFRQWMGRTAFWAFRNGCSMSCYPETN